MKRLYNLIALIMVLINANFYAQSCTTVNNFPFKETFEENSPSRSCWTQEVIGGEYPGYEGWVFQTGAGGGSDYNIVNAHSGLLNATTQGFIADSQIRLISPKMDVSALQTPTVSFFMGQESWGIYQNLLKVYYRISPTSEWKLLKTYFANVPNWKQEVLSLPEKSSELQVCFEGVMETGRSNVLDDVVIGNSDSVETYPSACAPSTPSNNFESGSGDLKLLYLANDFNVAAHTNLTVTNIVLNTIDKGGIENYDISIKSSDDSGLPSETIYSYESVVPNSVVDLSEREGFTFRKNTFNLPSPAVLVGGSVGNRYWLVVKAVNKIAENASFMESTTIKNSGKEIYFSGDGIQWNAVNNNVDGVFTLVGSCSETNPTEAYCTPKFNFLMSIDKVKIGTIDNASTNEVPYEDFSSVKSDVERGKTYPLQINAQTFAATSAQAITVFVDWNQNGYLGDEGEIYNIGEISQDNGNTITYQLPIPMSAALGNARMRVISDVNDYATFACNVFDQGQAEDYTLNVLKESLAVSEAGKNIKTAIYPNPAKDIVTIKNNSDLMIAEIFDMNGRMILSSSSKQIDISKLSTGQYLIRSTFKNGSTDTQKLIKQ